MNIESFLKKQNEHLEILIGDKVNIEKLSCNPPILRNSIPVAKIESIFDWSYWQCKLKLHHFIYQRKQLE